MSKKKNNKVKKQQGETYAQALSRKKQAHDDWIADIMSQINFDAACFAARDVFHMGPTRAPDQGLLKIVGEENFVPSRIRYVGR